MDFKLQLLITGGGIQHLQAMTARKYQKRETQRAEATICSLL